MKPKLTLRDLFWLTLVIAMGCGWWVDHARLAEKSRRAEWKPRGFGVEQVTAKNKRFVAAEESSQ